MSYSQQADDRRGAAREVRTPRTPRSGDAFEEESRKIQESVRKITSQAADLRKETNLICHSPASGRGREKADEDMRESRAAHEAALQALQSLGRAASDKSLSVEEQNSRKFMHQKLSENLTTSMKVLEKAFSEYQVAEGEARRKQAAAAAEARAAGVVPSPSPSTQAWSDPGMKTSLLSAAAGAPGIDLASPEETDLERTNAAPQMRAQALQHADPLPAESEMHAAIAEEYARDLTNLSQDMQSLQRAMVDLADVTTAQGMVLDDIENNVSSAVSSTEAASEQLLEASRQQSKGRKRFMYLMAIVGSAAAVGALLS